MNMLDVAACALTIVPVVLLGVFTAETIAGLWPLAPHQPQENAPHPSTTVLIPAHNEAAGISATITLLADEPAEVSVLVVADNCTDETAARAREAGARVVERTDPSRRGKGYALEFGRTAMAAQPPECVIVLDADVAVGGRGLAALARAAMSSGRAMQARYLQRPNLLAPTVAQVSDFAFLIKNLVRQRGMVRIGGVAALTGAGMAIPWDQFARAELGDAELAEDLALCVWLTRMGLPPGAEESVHVWSDAASGAALLTQRGRWERGFLSIARRRALPLIIRGIVHGSRSQMWLGFHLLVPPLALLLAGASGAFAADALLAVAGASARWPLALGVALATTVIAAAIAWRVEGRGRISGRALLTAPIYVMSKFPLYAALLRRRRGPGWVRTRRPGETE